MPQPAKSPNRAARWSRWLTATYVVPLEQRVAILLVSLAGGAAVATALGEDVEIGVFPYGFTTGFILLLALDAYYRLSSRRKNGSK
jgi:hypothetical protein